MITLELPLETERLLRLVAQQRGVALEEVVAERLTLSPQELEDLEDEIDLAAVRRARLEDDPKDHKTLDDLRAALAQRAR